MERTAVFHNGKEVPEKNPGKPGNSGAWAYFILKPTR
jgi:hypothetical protein